LFGTLRTFKNIFDSEIEIDGTEKIFVRPTKIIIPIIQRDYAQGRKNTAVNRVRKNFLEALYKAVTISPIVLDFVYGDIDDEGILTPLDGQQRLTTLFLLHWYAAKKENISVTETKFLENFSYETRPDSREFCKQLINFLPTFQEETLSAEIEDQSWFPLGWKKDPTVNSMLNMLDDIEKKFCGVENLFEKLQGGAISFYFLPIKNIGLTDELYITMNSRGKLLTNFEHFKAEFKSLLDFVDTKISERIIFKIDTSWTDLLWKYRDDKNFLVDEKFLNYFRFLCDILLYKSGGTTQHKDREPFALLDEFFSGSDEEILSRVAFMEKSFDCWLEIEDIDKFFGDKISLGSKTDKNVNQHQRGKIIIYHNKKNLFADCLDNYGKNFSLNRTVLLYSFLIYLFNRENISEQDFCRRIRIINNLLINSEASELSDSESRQGGNRLPAMLKQVESILCEGKILNSIGPNFNDYQLSEEREKLLWTEKNPDKAESLFELEDHYLLQGQIEIVGLEYPEYFESFISLFECDYDKIDCALLTKGDYLQEESNGRFQLGTNNPKSWQNLFHKSVLTKGYEDTQAALSSLLHKRKNFSDNYLDSVCENYLRDCESEKTFYWTYYYIKYSVFRPKMFGKYDWYDFKNSPYTLSALVTEQRKSSHAYRPFLKAVDIGDHMDQEYQGDFLTFDKYYIVNLNSEYVVKKNSDNAVVDKLTINQQNGIDTEDRILKFRNWDKKKDYFI